MSELKNRNYLKSKFKDGDRPTQKDFGELIDSSLNQPSDQIFAVDKKLGIGTTKPRAPLEVLGYRDKIRQSVVASDGKNSTFHIAHPMENLVALGGDVNTSLMLGTFSKETSSFQSKMTITERGIVRIGTKPEKGGLVVNGDTLIHGNVKVKNKLSLGDGILQIDRGQLYLVFNGTRHRVKLEKNEPAPGANLGYWIAIITGTALLIMILLGICLELFRGQ